jgi:hypothetical protein
MWMSRLGRQARTVTPMADVVDIRDRVSYERIPGRVAQG